MQVSKFVEKHRITLGIILFVLAIIMNVTLFISEVANGEFVVYKTFIFILCITLLGFMIFALRHIDNKNGFVAVYILVKAMDGICNPISGCITISKLDTPTPLSLTRAIIYLVCAGFLFLSIVFLVLTLFIDKKIMVQLFELLTLLAIFAAIINLILTIISISIEHIHWFEVLDPIYDIFLFTGLYIISPLAITEREEKTEA